MLLSKIKKPGDLKTFSYLEIKKLAREIREFLLKNVSQTGGHLASNLGIVELTLALHKFLNCPKDKIIWDVGHQCYTHKILTGRKNCFSKLRQAGGISGFPKREESSFDSFGTGHASTSISAAVGIAEALKKQKKNQKTVAVIGDGALTGGIALEAINQIGYLQTKIIIVLNDNKMSIAPNVGALSGYTKRVRKTKTYKTVRNEINHLINSCFLKDKVWTKKLVSLKNNLKKIGASSLFFEKLGINYFGPVDGHSVYQITKSLEKAARVNGPSLVHVCTKKGMGYEIAEKDPDNFHGISPFSVRTGEVLEKKNGISFTQTFGKKLLELARKDKRIIAITAAMTSGTGLADFANELEDQFYDVGICEQHAVTFAAGLAASGLKPVVAIYSTFLQRAYDQIVHDVCLQKLPVVFAIDRAGIVGEDGPTHHGVFDLSFLRHIPNMSIMAPQNNAELKAMLEFALKFKEPIAIRYPRGYPSQKVFPEWCRPHKKITIGYGKSEQLYRGNQLAIIFAGNQKDRALEYASKQKVKPTLINARFIKPLDPKIFSEIKRTGKAVIIEENVKSGGFGSAILEGLAKRKIKAEIKTVGIEDSFVEQGETEELKRKYIR